MSRERKQDKPEAVADKVHSIVRLTPSEVRAYLDRCIRYWRNDDREFSRYYVDAFQSVRSSLLGELLPSDKPNTELRSSERQNR